ncbi:MAG: hypothetical protein KJ574_04195 [Nanoarchaeota archaeon]|nr:hypothetical protein [Nanoarchaeota archaeon]
MQKRGKDKMILLIMAYVLIAFTGFAVGRFGDKYGGHMNVPHHWIYGFLCIVTGGAFSAYTLGTTAIAFGVGHFISDMNDFLNLKLYGADEPHEWKFWSIN